MEILKQKLCGFGPAAEVMSEVMPEVMPVETALNKWNEVIFIFVFYEKPNLTPTIFHIKSLSSWGSAMWSENWPICWHHFVYYAKAVTEAVYVSD